MAVFDDNISLEAALSEAARLEQAGDHDAALTIYDNLHQRHPSDADVKYRMGTAMLRLGRLEDALPVLRQVVFNAPDHTAARSNLGNALLLLDQLDRAEEAFRAVLDFEPRNKNALFGLATILIRQQRHKDAIPLTQRLLKELPDSAAALTLAAEAGSTDPQLDAAIARYRQALRVDSDYVPAYLGLGRALQQRKRSEEALRCADAAIARQPKKPDGYELKGWILFETQDYKGSEAAYLAALDREPEAPRILTHLAAAARKAGKHRRALDYAERAWSLAPSDKAAGKGLGSTLSALGESALAREVLLTGGARDDVAAETLIRIRKLADNARKSPDEEQSASKVTGPAEPATETQSEPEPEITAEEKTLTESEAGTVEAPEPDADAWPEDEARPESDERSGGQELPLFR